MVLTSTCMLTHPNSCLQPILSPELSIFTYNGTPDISNWIFNRNRKIYAQMDFPFFPPPPQICSTFNLSHFSQWQFRFSICLHTEPWCHPWHSIFSHTLGPIFEDILFSLPWKYIQNVTTPCSQCCCDTGLCCHFLLLVLACQLVSFYSWALINYFQPSSSSTFQNIT